MASLYVSCKFVPVEHNSYCLIQFNIQSFTVEVVLELVVLFG